MRSSASLRGESERPAATPASLSAGSSPRDLGRRDGRGGLDLNFHAQCGKLLIPFDFQRVFPWPGGVQPGQQSRRQGPQGGGDRRVVRANHNSRSINGAHPARGSELHGYHGAEAPLQASDPLHPVAQRRELGVLAQQSG